MPSILIRSAAVVTMDPVLGTLPVADILVVDGAIAAVGRDLHAPSDADVVDASGTIAIPGLVNAHVHLWQTAVRGMGVDWSGAEFHRRMQTDFAPALRPGELHDSQLLGGLALLDGGVTSVLDWCHGAVSPEHVDGALAGLRDAGIRGVFALGTPKTLPRDGEPHYSTVPHSRAEAERVRATFGDDDLLGFALGILGPDYAGIEVNRADLLLAADLDVMTSAHVHRVGATPDAYVGLAAEGLLRTPHNAVHATGLDDDQLRTVLDHGGSVTATSMTEIGGGGAPPVVGRVVDLGGAPSIGTDSEAGTAADMLSATRETLAIERWFDAQRRPRQGGAPLTRGSTLPPRRTPSSLDALRWATLDNARALGIDHLVGSLTPGKRADVVLVRADAVNTAPGLHPVDTVVALAHAGNVDAVLVDGAFVKRDGAMLRDADVRRAAASVRATGERLLHDLGLESLRGTGGSGA